MKTLGIIPARYASTRLPGKPLAMIHGYPMIYHVYQQVQKAGLDKVVLAIDNEDVAAACEKHNLEYVMTREDHCSGTNRVIEVAEKLPEFDNIINIQGDEPIISPLVIESIKAKLTAISTGVVSAFRPFDGMEAPEEPNVVKVVIGASGKALYFSRSLIPFPQKQTGLIPNQHIGIYGYKRSSLLEIAKLPSCVLEATESLEQLRWLSHDIDIHMVETDLPAIGVDTEEDLEKVRQILGSKEYSAPDKTVE